VAKVDYRPLSQTDLQVIKEKLEKDEVTLQAFSLLWRWFRSLEDSINLIRDDWCKDQPKVIYGILNRSQTEDLLRTSPVGTFILRFSENPQNLGCIVLGYVEDNKSIRHSLIDIKSGTFEMKTSGELFRFSSLAELVTSCKPLRLLYPNTMIRILLFVKKKMMMSHIDKCSPMQTNKKNQVKNTRMKCSETTGYFRLCDCLIITSLPYFFSTETIHVGKEPTS